MDPFTPQFAELFPTSSKASRSLDIQIEILQQSDEQNLKRFIKDIPNKISDTDSDHDASNTDSHSFVLSFRILPADLSKKQWSIGKGPSDSDSLEFIIAPLKDKTIYASLSFHPRSGYLMLKAHRPKVSIKRDGVFVTVVDTCLPSVENYLRFGNLEYCLKYTISSPDSYIKDRHEFMVKDTIISSTKLHTFPSWEHSRRKHYAVHETLANGAFGIVSTGVNTITGEPVAIKELSILHRKDIPGIKREAEISNKFKEKITGILQTDGLMCEHREGLPCGAVPEKFFIVTRLAYCDFEYENWSFIPKTSRLPLFRGTLEGLCFLHDSGYIHRDISTRNLLITRIDPPEAAIADFGKTVSGLISTGASIGPTNTLAPEVWIGEYDAAIDVWSLAYAWLDSYPGEILKDKITPEIHTMMLVKVIELSTTDQIDDRLTHLFQEMFIWNSKERITAAAALKYLDDCDQEERRRFHEKWDRGYLNTDGPFAHSTSTSSDENVHILLDLADLRPVRAEVYSTNLKRKRYHESSSAG